MGRKNKQGRLQSRQKVRKNISKVAKTTPDKYTVDQFLDKAEECMDTFSYDLAQKFCQRALEIDNDCIRGLEMSGTLLLETGNFEEAKQCFGHAIEIEPESGHSKYMYMGQLLTGKDAIQCFYKGIDIIEKHIQSQGIPSTESPSEDIEGASCSSKHGNSENTVTKADLSRAYCSVAEIYLTDACFEEDAESKCKDCLEQAESADSSNPEAFHLQASYYMSLDNHKLAEECLDKGISLWLPQLKEAHRPDGATAVDPVQICEVNYPARINVAKILIELNKYELATDILELLLDEDDKVAEVWYLLGWANYQQGDYYKATARYYLEKAQKVAVEHVCEDEQLVSHIKELLKEIGPVEEGEEEEAIEETGDMDTDSEEEATQVDHMEH